MGAIQMRAGQYEQALVWFDKALEAEATSDTSSAYASFFAAMTRHRLDQSDEARSLLADAIKLADAELNDPASVPSWNRKLTLELLRREAESLILGSSADSTN